MTNYQLYRDKIESGEILVGEKIKRTLEMHSEYFEHGNKVYEFDKEKSDRVIKFVQTFIKHSIGELSGKPFKLELWQKVIVELSFGIVHKETRMRMMRQVFVVVGRKNGKSTFMAGLCLYMLIADKEGAPEIYCAATKKDQAKIIFEECHRMIKQDAVLSKITKKRQGDISHLKYYGIIKPVASDGGTLDGLNPHFIVLDEIHAHKSREVYDVMLSAMGSRPQQLMFMITTAGFVRDSIYDDLASYASDIHGGIIKDKSFISFIYDIDDESEFNDMKMLEKANPNMGISKNVEAFDRDMQAAIVSIKDKLNFLTKTCNLPQNSVNTWLMFEDVTKCYINKIDDSIIMNKSVFIGVDLSRTTDLTAVSVLFKHEGKIHCISQGFIPKQTAAKAQKRDKAPYLVWAEEGKVTISGGTSVDYDDIIVWILKLKAQYKLNILSLGYDRWSAVEFAKKAEHENMRPEEVRQGAKTMSEPMKELERNILAGDFVYDSNLLKMGLLNTSIDIDANENIRPVKGKGDLKRIDPCVATIIAYTVYLDNAEQLTYVENLQKYKKDNL